jgi:CMP-N-acetylneuraminic acid synthetase
MSKRYVALIAARGGSKGLPGKNVLPLAGVPLIAWAVRTAHEVSRIERVIVSTDDEEIAVAARAAGATVPFMRPSELAQDSSPEWLVWRHALEHLRTVDGRYPDGLVVLPATAPLRAAIDVERCLDEFDRGRWDVVITVTDAHRNPYFNQVAMGSDGILRLAITGETGVPVRRQDAPPVFDVTTVAYVARPEFVMQHASIFSGRVGHVHVPIERALDIDIPLDFRIAECLFTPR